jgi:hypothetical protein
MNKDTLAASSDEPIAAPAAISRYVAYSYTDRPYSNVLWWPGTQEGHDQALAYANTHSGWMYGSDLIFGGYDSWVETYGGEEYAAVLAAREDENFEWPEGAIRPE